MSVFWTEPAEVTGLCFSVYHARRVSMYAPTTSPYGPPASLPPLPGAPPPMVTQPVYDYANMEKAAVGSTKKLKVVAGVLGLLSILLLATTITFGILYGTKGGETTVTVAPTTGPPSGTNPCSGADPGFSSIDCFDSSGDALFTLAYAPTAVGYPPTAVGTPPGRIRTEHAPGGRAGGGGGGRTQKSDAPFPQPFPPPNVPSTSRPLCARDPSPPGHCGKQTRAHGTAPTGHKGSGAQYKPEERRDLQ